MNKQEALETLDINNLKHMSGDIEAIHSIADKVLIDYLKSLGPEANAVAVAWENAHKHYTFWYA